MIVAGHCQVLETGLPKTNVKAARFIQILTEGAYCAD